MKRKMKRITSFLIVVAMLFSLVPTVLANPAEAFVDFPTGWSYEAMTAAVNNGLLVGFENGEIRPEANLTRAEMATIITRAFGAKTTADISAYTDVSPSAWYYDYIAKAVKMEIMQGVSSTEMNPEAPITREEVFTIVARVLVLEGGDAAVLNKFPDAGDISSWAKDSVIALAERGYVNGDHLGYATPQANITREEFAQLMHNAIRFYITAPGTYTTDVNGIAVIRVGNVTLKNFTTTSDLVVGDGAMQDAVTIESVTIGKRLLARGGTITVKTSTAKEGVVVKNVNSVTSFKNYRDEAFFKGIVEKTAASFLQRIVPSGGGGGGGGTVTKKYELTLMINGQEYDTIKVSSGRLGNDLPGAPEKKDLPVGYEFVRWLDEDGKEVTKDTKVTEDMILEAELKPIEFAISFKDKEGNDIVFNNYTPAATFNVENASSYVLPQAANIVAPEHYTFEDWVDKNGNPVTELKVTASTTDTVLTAVFKPTSYTLTYSTDQAIDWEFADGSQKTVDVTIEDFENLKYTLKTNVTVNTAGYHFVTWLDENGNPVEYLTPATLKTMTLKAYFAEDTKYTVTFANYTGFESVNWSFANGDPKTLNFTTVPYTLPAVADVTVTTADYEFIGWVDANGHPLTSVDTLANTTVYANFRYTYVPPTEYTITFVNADGYGNVEWSFANGDPKTLNFTTVPVTLPAIADVTVTTPDYEFIGWIDAGGNPITAVYELKNQTVYANFKPTTLPPTVYAITFMNHSMCEGAAWSFKNGDPKTIYLEASDFPYTLPSADDLAIENPDYHFVRWYDTYRKPSNEITVIETPQDVTVYAYIRTMYRVTYNTYTPNVQWEFKAGYTAPDSYYLDEFPTLPTADDINVLTPGYRFAGWVDRNGNPLNLRNGDWEVYAKFESTIVPTYTVTFENYTGFANVEWSFANGDPKTASFTTVPYTLPAVSEVTVTTADYEFVGWVDANGNPVTSVDALANTTVYANFRYTYVPPTEYTITFANYTGFEGIEWSFANGDPKTASFTTVPYTLPAVSEVTVTTADYEFTGWVDATGRAVLTIETLENTTVYANFRSTVIPPEMITVTFYRGYGDSKRELVRGNSTVEVEIGTTIPEADIPVNNALQSVLYDKDEDLSGDIASIYVDEEPYIIKPTYWYEKITRDDNGEIIARELVSYDKDVIITKDITEVYVLYQAFMLMFEFDADNTMALSATANYTEDTRLLDSLKTLLLSGRDSYNLADSLGMLPEQYEKALDLAKEKLIDANVLDANDNIQIIYVPIRLSALIKENTLHNMVKQFVRDSVMDTAKLHYILDVVDFQSLGISVPVGATNAQKEALLNAYLATLKGNEKIVVADQIYDDVKVSSEYKAFVNSIMNEDTFALGTGAQLETIELMSHTIRDLTYEEAMAENFNETLKKVLDIMGDAFLREYYEAMKKDFCDGLDAAIARVRNSGVTESYTTSLTMKVNVIDLLEKLYEKAQPILVEKIANRNVKYDENIYVKHLVEGHDVIGSLFDGDVSLATDTFSGYTLKGILDYYNYLLGLLFVADDALIWYGDDGNLSQEEFDAVYDAVIGKALIAHEKLNEILAAYNEDGTLPAQVQKAFDKVKKLNDLVLKFEPKIREVLDKYFASDLNGKLENGIIPGEDKALTFIDILLGQEDPVFTIDSVYEIFYRFDDNAQAKLQQLIDSGKLEQAIKKFEDTDFGSLFKDNKYAGKVADKIEEIKQTGKVQSAFGSIYDLMQIIAKEGIEPFRTREDEVNVKDAYRVTVGSITFTISRDYQ